jgi:hypothetical protein
MPAPSATEDVTCKRCLTIYRHLDGDVYERLADAISA